MEYTLSTPEIARRLGKTTKAVSKWIKTGKLPALKVGRTYRISESDLEAFIARARVIPTPPKPAVEVRYTGTEEIHPTKRT